MRKGDTATQPLHDVLSAFGLLTRLPFPQTSRHRADAAWCWPLVGIFVAGIGVVPATLLAGAGLSQGAAAALCLGLLVLSTGGLHEDGLADSFDGLFGGHTTERRLEIMKDSRIGSYGTLAIVVVTLGVWSSLSALIGEGRWMAILAAAALSRCAMAVVMALLPGARKSGLSSHVGRPGRVSAAASAALGIGFMLATLPPLSALWMTLGTGLVALWIAWQAHRKIGGQTGDILGATQQLGFMAALMAAQI